MSRAIAIRWWPPIGLLAMVLLGLAVGQSSTPLDDWFQHVRRVHRGVYALLLFTDARLVVLLFLVALVIALVRRQWRLAAVVFLTPPVAVAAVRILKRLFDREKLGALAYPSGHITVTVVVLGLLVIVTGPRVWKFVVAAVWAFFGLLGQAFTFHYFTDTVGAVFLGTALLCLAVRAARLDTCQPHCDLHHSSG
jgi:hypothetical protein